MPLFALRFCPDSASGSSEIFYFQPLLFRGVCCPAVFSELLFLLSELFFFLLGCCLPSEASGALPALFFAFFSGCTLFAALFPHAFFPRLLSRTPFFRALFPARFLFARPLSRAPFSARPLSRALSFPRALFPARPLPRVPSSPHAFFSRLLSRALSFRALFPARSLSRAPFSRTSSFRTSRAFLPRLHFFPHASRPLPRMPSFLLGPSPQLEFSPIGASAERNGSGWNGPKWDAAACAIVFYTLAAHFRAVYVMKLLNIFRIFLKYLHNSKRLRIFAVKF